MVARTSKNPATKRSSRDLTEFPWGLLPLIQPIYLGPSAWHEHIPFAFWIANAMKPRTFVELGTHWGVSYFAFCQAFQKLELGTTAYAVDNWKGDRHAGHYGDEVFDKVSLHNARHYNAFSRLVRSDFDKALEHFSDGAIDLLHIDGLHTFEAAHHDFEKWLPKLSRRGVVLLHDTNVRERDFGVFKVFESLRKIYPAFEFVHGHGLGVLGVGPDQEAPLKELFRAQLDPKSCRQIREVFSQLGSACKNTYALQQQQERISELTKVINQKAEEESVVAARPSSDATRHTHSKLRDRCTELERLNTELAEKVDSLKSEIADQSALLSLTEKRIAPLQTIEQQYQTLSKNHAKLQSEHVALIDKYTAASTRIEQLEKMLATNTESQKQTLARFSALKISAKIDHDRANRALAALQHEQEDGKRGRELFRELAMLTRMLKAKEAELDSSKQKTSPVPPPSLTKDREEDLHKLRASHERAEQRLKECFEEIAILTRKLKDTQSGSSAFDEIAVGQRVGKAILAVLAPASRARFPLPLAGGSETKRCMKIMRESGLFDADWYTKRYVDVAAAGIDPLLHYIRHGAKEGRLPHSMFAGDAERT